MKTIDFWFDYISHNAYLAWHGLKQTAAEFDLEIRPQPVVFAGLLNHYGGKGPAELPAKSHWMLKNVLRKAHHMGLPIQPPASHPFNPLLTLRATLAINDMEQRRQFVERMFQAIWAQSHDASSTDTITLCCRYWLGRRSLTQRRQRSRHQRHTAPANPRRYPPKHIWRAQHDC